MPVSRPNRRARRREHGQAMVEFALLLPILLIVAFSVMDFGAALYDQVMLASAAQNGARAGAIAGGSKSTAVSAAQGAVNNAIGCTLQTPTAAVISGPPQQMQVTVQCTYNGITPLGKFISIAFPTITTSASAKIEQ